jgi:hypothetical protein
VFNAALALSIIPLTKPTIPLDLAAEDRNIRSMMTPLSRTEWDSRCRARSVINFSVRRNSETNQQYRVSVAEVTDEGSIFAACDLPIVTSGADQRVVYFEKIERQLMLEAGQYMQLLVQRLKVNSPFVVGLSLINVHNVYLLSSAPFASDPSPISVANINPQSSIVCIDGDPADYSSVTSKFAAGLRVTMNEIWREAGQTKDHQYDINGEMFGH